MLNKKDWIIAAHLRQNSRIPLTELSRKTGIPVSTLFDHIKNQDGTLYAKHIALINFTSLGYTTKAHILLRTPKQTKENVQRFLEAHWNVNTIYKINNKYDFMAECVFKHMRELQDFLDLLDEKYRVKDIQVHYIVDEIKREAFLTDPSVVEFLRDSAG